MPNSSLKVEPYQPLHCAAWNGFVATSKNATFLFDRGYMDYHADRFPDHSSMIYDDGELIAIFPATKRDDRIISHGGLTYGGVLTSTRMTTQRMLDVFELLRQYYGSQAARLVYKTIPYIYSEVPADEDLYALFRCGASLIRRDVSSAIHMPQRLLFAKGKKYNLSKAVKAGVQVRRTDDYAAFWAIETEVLKAHGASPVHSLAEIQLLAKAFPQHIALHAAYRGDSMLAGVVTYANRRTAHAQYMGASAEGRDCGALDAVVAYLLDHVFADYRYFDFGISTENAGMYLNEGLIAQKEMLGGRAVMYDHYEVNL